MITLLVVALILGAIITGLTGQEALFLPVAVFFFICGLPWALVTSFVHNEVSYTQDRADYRAEMSEITAEELADEHEYAEDERIDRLVEAVKKIQKKTYNDNRQVRFYGRDV
jgi:ABC-type transport system involved in cytochrome bd biosynthesis fused ATPase/permease subunit